MMGGNDMARITDLHRKWMKGPKYRNAYEALEEEFVLASAVIDARNRAGLTQQELAQKMGTTQPVVARLESGRVRPSMRHAGAAGGGDGIAASDPLRAARREEAAGVRALEQSGHVHAATSLADLRGARQSTPNAERRPGWITIEGTKHGKEEADDATNPPRWNPA
jgi:transcriptional regulator with XRE-family HTH domain